MEDALQVSCPYCRQPPKLQCVIKRGGADQQRPTGPHRKRNLKAQIFSEHRRGEHLSRDWDCELCSTHRANMPINY